MSQLAVKELIRTAIATQVDKPVPVDARRQRPKQDTIGSQSVAVVWIRESPERRFTMPKGPGSKMARHQVVVMLYFKYTDADEGGDLFDVFKAQVLKAIRSIAIPSAIADPLTGDTSNLVFLSEDITPRDFEPVQDEGTEADVIFTATVSFPAEEVFQA